jgi:hypothetical protein
MAILHVPILWTAKYIAELPIGASASQLRQWNSDIGNFSVMDAEANWQVANFVSNRAPAGRPLK